MPDTREKSTLTIYEKDVADRFRREREKHGLNTDSMLELLLNRYDN